MKNLHLLAEAAALLKQQDFVFAVKFAGTPLTAADDDYYADLKKLITDRGLDEAIDFSGSIAHRQVVDFYRSADLFVNVSDTGSLDKAILEAMSCGLLVLTSNDSARKILPERFIVKKDPADIAAKILSLYNQRPHDDLRQLVVSNHSLKGLVAKILSYY